jgi:hypothetical protein
MIALDGGGGAEVTIGFEATWGVLFVTIRSLGAGGDETGTLVRLSVLSIIKL